MHHFLDEGAGCLKTGIFRHILKVYPQSFRVMDYYMHLQSVFVIMWHQDVSARSMSVRGCQKCLYYQYILWSQSYWTGDSAHLSPIWLFFYWRWIFFFWQNILITISSPPSPLRSSSPFHISKSIPFLYCSHQNRNRHPTIMMMLIR